MARPDFILIGAGRSGTTSLYHYLSQHPEIAMSPIKETNFFSWDPADAQPPSDANPLDGRDLQPVRSWDGYQALFASAAGQITGEASPRYLRDPAAPARIAARLPDVRLIAILRNPVDRAYSSYLMYVREGIETRSFEAAVRDEKKGLHRTHVSGQWHYLDVGYYYRHLSRYLEVFPPERMLLCFYEDLRETPLALMQNLQRFLGVDERFEPDISIRHNGAGVPRSRLLHWALKKRPWTTAIRRRLSPRLLRAVYRPAMDLQRGNLAKAPLPPELRSELAASFREDVLKLQDLVRRDLSGWLA